jgi:hypothetical protein
MAGGDHLAAMEEPELTVHDIRTRYRVFLEEGNRKEN